MSYLAVTCGVGGGGLAAIAAGVDPKKMVLNDVCKHRCQRLRERFPAADVVPGDITVDETQRKIIKRCRGRTKLMEASHNCQLLQMTPRGIHN